MRQGDAIQDARLPDFAVLLGRLLASALVDCSGLERRDAASAFLDPAGSLQV
jgi:hypothetical protein